MSGYAQLPPPHHYETPEGIPVVGWWLPDTGSLPVYAVIHWKGQFVTTDAPYRLRAFKSQTNPTSAPDVDNTPKGSAP